MIDERDMSIPDILRENACTPHYQVRYVFTLKFHNCTRCVEPFHINSIYQRLRTRNISYYGASAVMELTFPRGEDTIHNDFTNSVERADIPLIEAIQIV